MLESKFLKFVMSILKWKAQSLQILHYSQFSWHITLLKLKHYILWIKGSHCDTFKCSGENLPNSSRHFPKHKPVFPQILHHSLVSWKKSPWYFLGQTYFLQKESIKVQSFETFECSGQNCQIFVVFETRNQFFFKFCITFQYYETKFLCTFLAGILYACKDLPIKVQIWWSFKWALKVWSFALWWAPLSKSYKF